MNAMQKITQAGIELFKTVGYEETTIGMICEKAQVSKGTFYYHYQGKSDLIYEHVEQFLNDIGDVMPEILSLESPRDQLWELYRYAFANVVDMTPGLLLAYYKVDMDHKLDNLSPSNEGALLYHSNAMSKMLLSLVRKCQAVGEVRKDHSAEELILAFNSAITGTGLDWACKNGNYDEITRLKLIFDIIFSKA